MYFYIISGFIFCVLIYLLGKYFPALPLNAQIVVFKIGGERIIINLCKEATILSMASNNIKKIFVVNEIKDLYLEKTGKTLSISIANVIVDTIYLKYKNTINQI